jgi:hypothetical protein
MNNNNSNLEFRKIKSLYFLYEINENGTILRNVKSKKNIKIFLDESGYYDAFINLKGVVTRVMIHKVVAECWLGDIPEGYEIDHIDRNSRNNHYSNLRYITYNKICISKPVTIVNSITKEKLCFKSISEASNYIAEYYSKEKDHVRSKMKKRRSRIFDFNIYYSECRD